MTDSPRLPASDDTAPKLPWHAPSLEEIDYVDTEAGVSPGATYDAPFYTT